MALMRLLGCTLPATLYSIAGYITSNTGQITSQWDGSSYPVDYAAELVTADTNAEPGILQSSEQQAMLNELNCEATMGVKAVTVEIDCPVFDPNFYIFSGQTAAQAQQTVQSWLSYYQSLAQAIHQRGLKMIVEANPLLTYYISSDSSFNPGPYYKTLVGIGGTNNMFTISLFAPSNKNIQPGVETPPGRRQ